MRDDARGLEGIPLQLLVVSVVVSITIPTIYAGLSGVERQQLDARVRNLVLKIVTTARTFLLAGGGSEVLAVDLTGLLTVSVDYVRFGGPGGEASLVRYRLVGEPERTVVSDPTVAMAGPGGDAFVLGAGLHRVRVAFGEGGIELSVA